MAAKTVLAAVPEGQKYLKTAGSTVPVLKSANGFRRSLPCGISSSGNKMFCAMPSTNEDGSRQVALHKDSSYNADKADHTVWLIGASFYKGYLMRLGRKSLTFKTEKTFQIPASKDPDQETCYIQGGCAYKNQKMYLLIAQKTGGTANNYSAVLPADLSLDGVPESGNVIMSRISVGSSSVFELESLTINTSGEMVGIISIKEVRQPLQCTVLTNISV